MTVVGARSEPCAGGSASWRQLPTAALSVSTITRGCLTLTPRSPPSAVLHPTPTHAAAAHLHNAFDLVRHQGYSPARAAAASAFTAGFTYVFGLLAVALLLRTGSLGAPVAAHVFCNVYGLPDFAGMAAHRRGWTLLGVTAAGVVGFFWALGRLPEAFGVDLRAGNGSPGW